MKRLLFCLLAVTSQLLSQNLMAQFSGSAADRRAQAQQLFNNTPAPVVQQRSGDQYYTRNSRGIGPYALPVMTPTSLPATSTAPSTVPYNPHLRTNTRSSSERWKATQDRTREGWKKTQQQLQESNTESTRRLNEVFQGDNSRPSPERPSGSESSANQPLPPTSSQSTAPSSSSLKNLGDILESPAQAEQDVPPPARPQQQKPADVPDSGGPLVPTNPEDDALRLRLIKDFATSVYTFGVNTVNSARDIVKALWERAFPTNQYDNPAQELIDPNAPPTQSPTPAPGPK